MSNTQLHAVTIDVEGNALEVVWESDGGVLRHLQEAVGGTVDVVALHESLDMWVNDNGLIEGLNVNTVSTRIARAFGLTSQAYVGPVVFTGGANVEGAAEPAHRCVRGAIPSMGRPLSLPARSWDRRLATPRGGPRAG